LHIHVAAEADALDVAAAARPLATTRLAMAEIAERTGFPNAACFSRVFHYVISRSPLRYSRDARPPEQATAHRRPA
jgi:transcriptional regulator GlxA family with amidase domain